LAPIAAVLSEALSAWLRTADLDALRQMLLQILVLFEGVKRW